MTSGVPTAANDARTTYEHHCDRTGMEPLIIASLERTALTPTINSAAAAGYGAIYSMSASPSDYVRRYRRQGCGYPRTWRSCRSAKIWLRSCLNPRGPS